MNTATTITAVEYWQHIIDATLYAIDNDEPAARQELAAAERIMPVPEAAWRAVLGASFDEMDEVVRFWQAEYDQMERANTQATNLLEKAEAERDQLRDALDMLARWARGFAMEDDLPRGWPKVIAALESQKEEGK